jgi:hypothetical protein
MMLWQKKKNELNKKEGWGGGWGIVIDGTSFREEIANFQFNFF